jgi:ABC-2 type transport system ATP-binding protein
MIMPAWKNRFGEVVDGVACSGVGFRYGSHVALEDVEFRALPGRVTGLVGPNGAGKTTLLRVLTTVLPSQRGDFTVATLGPDHAERIRERIGVLPESSGYPLRKTGLAYLRYFAHLYGLDPSRATDRAERLLVEVGLDARGTDRIGTYSRGMRQRLGIARALVNEPEVLFLDEPTLGLDPAGQREVLRTISDVAHVRGATVILSSHLLGDVEKVCDWLVILNAGRVVAQGTTADLVTADAHRAQVVLSVPPRARDRARELLRSLPETDIDVGDDPRAIKVVTRVDRSDGSVNHLLRRLIDAGIPLLTVDVSTTRLSDVFLELTSDG